MQSILWPDLVILAIILLSILISFFRGFIKEVISLLSWMFAAWMAFLLAAPLADYMTFTKVESIRAIVAFMIVFVGLIFMGSLVNFIVGRFIRKTPFSMADRTLGLGFGALRGVLVVSLLVFFAGLTPMPQDQWWQQSFTINKFQNIALWIKDALPEQLATNFDFEPAKQNGPKQSLLEQSDS